MNILKKRLVRKINKIFVHCTAYANQDLKGIELRNAIDQWHKARGWNGIGYHGVIDCEGTYVPGRSLEKRPAAQGGHNSGTLAFCLDGLFIEQFNQKQFITLLFLADKIDAIYGDEVTYHGHCEVNSKKTCPVFDYKKILGLDAFGKRKKDTASIDLERTVNLQTSFKIHNEENPDVNRKSISKTSRGNEVKLVQSILNIDIDGIFGAGTFNAVVKFQKERGLHADGIVGPSTWAALISASM